ncbi:hypothetical protein TNCV_4827351 [Trichonephila clavipes]|nr:hypothetical protein TNCV_4827351 [Trichonephila clavipes]
MTEQRYIYDILQPHVLPPTAPRSHFSTRQYSPLHGKSVTRQSLHGYNPTWPARFPDLSQFELIWDYLGPRIWHPTSLNELEARLQQI